MSPDDRLEPTTEHTVILQDESLKQFQGGFTAIPNRLMENADLSLDARMVYAMLLKFAWQKDFCFPPQDRIATDLGIGIRSVRTYLNEFREAGLITWKQQGLNRPTVYYLLKLPSVAPTPPRSSGPANLAAPDRQDSSGQDRQKSAYKEDSYKKTQDVNVDKNRKGKNPRGPIRLASDTTPIGEVIGARYTQLAAESAAQLHTTGTADPRTDAKAHEDDFINEIMDQLGDTNPRSRPTYRLILRTFGTDRTNQLVGQAKEA
jgi:hypothetical protein